MRNHIADGINLGDDEQGQELNRQIQDELNSVEQPPLEDDTEFETAVREQLGIHAYMKTQRMETILKAHNESMIRELNNIKHKIVMGYGNDELEVIDAAIKRLSSNE